MYAHSHGSHSEQAIASQGPIAISRNPDGTVEIQHVAAPEGIADWVALLPEDLRWISQQLREIHRGAPERPDRRDPDIGVPVPYESLTRVCEGPSPHSVGIDVHGSRSVDVCCDSYDFSGVIEFLPEELPWIADQLERLAPGEVAG